MTDKKKVLVVDDSQFMLQIARQIITNAGFDAVTATTCIEANSQIFSQPCPVMILIDVEMPMLSGDKTTRFLKDRMTNGNIPILLMSQKTEEQMRELCAACGADGYITKPLTYEKFRNAFKQHCS